MRIGSEVGEDAPHTLWASGDLDLGCSSFIGTKRSRVDVVADNVQFLGSGAGKENGADGKGSAGGSAGSSRSGGRAGQGQETDEESYEDIPFAEGYDPGMRIVRDIL